MEAGYGSGRLCRGGLGRWRRGCRVGVGGAPEVGGEFLFRVDLRPGEFGGRLPCGLGDRVELLIRTGIRRFGGVRQGGFAGGGGLLLHPCRR